MRQDGTRAYANNEANFSVTSMNIEDGNCLTQQLDIDSSRAPCPGSFEHNVLVGKLAFFTAFGIPDNGFQHLDPRLHPAEFQGQDVEGRLEQLRVVPSGRAHRRDNPDFRHRAAPDQIAGRHVLQTEPGRSGTDELERRARQQHRLQHQLPCQPGGLRFRQR